ncbi:MAG: ABC transporter ATP-binding protein [Anaerolineae bacterium]
MDTVIQFDHVSKKFTLHRQQARSFQELVLYLLRKGKVSGASEERREEFWALRDVSLSVERGETVGLIGPNGAGKSTLLKLVSGIIKPTSGQVKVSGRLGALLELGAGFHPDLTGRENIYLNGSILGLSRSEIQAKMGEIIAFAELERFIDAPVRHYSSGMYVRLGFSVAVHTEPQILLVDEVLAVGDAAFQRKCMDKIDEMRRAGVTILFVSHSPDLVRKICKRAIWLDEGRCVADGSAEGVAARYLDHSWAQEQPQVVSGEERRWGNGKVRITDVRLLGGEGKERQRFRTGEPMTVEMHYVAEERIEQPVFGLAIHRSDGTHITGPNTRFAGQEIPYVEGRGKVVYAVRTLSLLEGVYMVSVAVTSSADDEMYDYHDRLYPFRVRSPGGAEQYGLITLDGEWQVC